MHLHQVSAAALVPSNLVSGSRYHMPSFVRILTVPLGRVELLDIPIERDLVVLFYCALSDE